MQCDAMQISARGVPDSCVENSGGYSERRLDTTGGGDVGLLWWRGNVCLERLCYVMLEYILSISAILGFGWMSGREFKSLASYRSVDPAVVNIAWLSPIESRSHKATFRLVGSYGNSIRIL